MLSQTHIRIANKILDELGVPISSEQVACLRGGSVAPDAWKDFPHHQGKTSNIKVYVLKARKYFLEENLHESFFFLGVAFHYIQDQWTTISGSDPKHASWEQQIERSSFIQDLEGLIQRIDFPEEQKSEYMRLIDFLSTEIEGKQTTFQLAALYHPRWGNPTADLNFAFRISLSIAKSVFGSKSSSKLQRELGAILKEYEMELKETETAFVDKLAELVQKQERMKKTKGIMRIFSGLLGRIYGLRVSWKITGYEKRQHLAKVSQAYNKVCKKVSAPYYDWYLVTIPQLDINRVEKEIFTLSEASQYLETREKEVFDLIVNNKISSFRIKERQFFRKSELRKISESERILLKIPKLIENLINEDKMARYKAIQALEQMFYPNYSSIEKLHDALMLMNEAAPNLTKCIQNIGDELKAPIDKRTQLLLMESLHMAKRAFLDFIEGEYTLDGSLKCRLCGKVCKPLGLRNHLSKMHPERWKKVKPYDEMYEKYQEIKDYFDSLAVFQQLRGYNRAARARYEVAGIKQWRWLTSIDLQTCPICRSLNGKRFNITVTRVPPIHLNCRCTIVPV